MGRLPKQEPTGGSQIAARSDVDELAPDSAKNDERDRLLAARDAEIARYRQLIEAAGDALIVHDDHYRFVEVNDGACDLMGYSRAELLTMSLADVDPQFNRFGITHMLAGLKLGDVLKAEGRFMRSDGVPIVVEVRVAPIDHPGGRRYMAFLRDTGDRKETVRALRESAERFRTMLDEARAELLRIERLATLGTLAAGVGHELNNLAQVLSINLGFARSAIEAGQVPDANCFADLEHAAGHVIQHAHHLLSFGRPGPDHSEPVDLRDVVRGTAAMLRHSGKLGHVALHFELGAAPLMVTVSRTRIEQVLINLLTNAADAFVNAGLGDAEVTIALERAGERVRCTVRDNGPGIAPEDLERVFEPFFTTKGDRGTGLGLSVVRRIVRDYGGDVTVESRLGAGATFTFDLPLAPAPWPR
jgi:PAS domain S-box-containing protein